MFEEFSPKPDSVVNDSIPDPQAQPQLSYEERMQQLEERFSVGVPKQKIKEGYQTASQLYKVLNSSPETIRFIVEGLRKNPLLEEEIQKNAKSGPNKPTEAYSPLLVEKIREKLKEKREDNIIKEGYKTANKFSTILKKDPKIIKSTVATLLANDPTLEGQIQRGARTGSQTDDAYSPILLQLIADQFPLLMKKGYLKSKKLGEILGYHDKTIKLTVKKILKENPLLKSEIQENARDGGSPSEAYSPFLIEKIKQLLDGLNPKEGYMTASQIRYHLGAAVPTIESAIETVKFTRPDLVSHVQEIVMSGKKKRSAYSPLFVDEIRKVIKSRDVNQGYLTVKKIAPLLNSTRQTIEFIVKEILKEDKFLEREIQTRNIKWGSGKSPDAYSPFFIERIREKLNLSRKQNMIKDGYQTANGLQNILNSNSKTIKTIVGKLCIDVPQYEQEVQRNAKIYNRFISDAYSPLLVEKIREKLKESEPKILTVNRGYIFQYSLELILKLVGNTNIFVEKTIKIQGRKGSHRPDLMHVSSDDQKVTIFDIKLQTTTIGIENDIENYSQYINDKYPQGGNLVFLCLNGPEIGKEALEGKEKVTVRYYHALDFIDRLLDNSRNKFLLRTLRGKENDSLSDTEPLTPEEITKIEEIKSRLLLLRDQIQGKTINGENGGPEQVAKNTLALRTKLGRLAKKATKEELLQLDYTTLMNV